MVMRELARRIMPAQVYSGARSLYRAGRSHWRALKRTTSASFSRDDLAAAWQSAGLQVSDVVMVHSSLSRLGNVDGGAQTVIRSLLDTITPGGTVLMPCYGTAAEVQMGMAEGRIVDLRTARPVTGKITDEFRSWPGVVRSSHPFSSVCALGPQADHLTSGHAADPHVCHPGSPLGRIVELNAKIAGIGVPLAVGLAVAHFLEDTYEGFPFAVHAPPFAVKYIDGNGDIIEREIIRYDPIVSSTRIDQAADGWILGAFTRHFTEAGILRWFRFGRADAWVMNARPLYDELRRLADKGITMYLTREQWKTMNDGNTSTDSW